MNQITLSIIVPVYNVKPYVKKCLDSITINSNINYEIIVVNDGSTDGSDIIVKNLIRNNDKIKFFSKENGGLSSARNFGIKEAKGKYIMFLDSDDYLDSKNLSDLLTYLSKVNYDIIVFDHIEYNDNTKLFKEIFDYNDYNVEKDGINFYVDRIIKRSFPASACFNVYKNEMIKKNKLYFKNGIYHEDEEWTPRVFVNAKTVIHINNKLYFYIYRDGSIMHSVKNIKKITDMDETIHSLHDFFNNFLKPDDYKLLYINDYLARQYMNIFVNVDRNLLKKIRKNIDYNFIKNNAYLNKTKLKFKIFRINISLYNLIKKIYR